MKMKLSKEEDLLDLQFRKLIIDEMEGPENQDRKREAYKRYEIYKDFIRKYVIADLIKQDFETATIAEMEQRIPSINLTKKITNKKARVYKYPPKRETQDEIYKEQLPMIEDVLKLNQRMKKINRYLELQKNAIGEILPYIDHKTGKWKLKIEVVSPHLYDIIEDEQNPEIPRVYIKSYYTENQLLVSENPEVRDGRVISGNNFEDGDYQDQIIADAPKDMGEDGKHYIVWSNKFHFTMDSGGNIIENKSPEGLENPIGELPIVNFAKDQDGAFWALGGSDISDGTVLANALLADMYFIAKIQGMGIFYLFGKGVPKSFRVGPNQGITVEVEEGDPTPQIGFASSNPPLESHMQMIEQFIAMLLTTNDMATNTVQGSLNATNATSGIHEIIQNSEPVGSIEDDQEIFRDNEPELMEKYNRFHNKLLDKQILHEDFAEIGKISENAEYTLKFGSPSQFINEKEKLEVMKMRRELGIDDLADSLMLDNSDLTREQALELAAEKMMNDLKNKMKSFMGENNGREEEQEEVQEQEEEKEIEEEEVEE